MRQSTQVASKAARAAMASAVHSRQGRQHRQPPPPSAKQPQAYQPCRCAHLSDVYSITLSTSYVTSWPSMLSVTLLCKDTKQGGQQGQSRLATGKARSAKGCCNQLQRSSPQPTCYRTCVRCLNSKPIWRAASTSAISSGEGPCRAARRGGRFEARLMRLSVKSCLPCQ